MTKDRLSKWIEDMEVRDSGRNTEESPQDAEPYKRDDKVPRYLAPCFTQ